MSLSHEIIRMLSIKAGYDVDTPAGANRLSLEMDLNPRTRLGRNTICRLTGVLPSSCTPRRSTLDAIAIYLGYKNWVHFLNVNPALKSACYEADHKFTRKYLSRKELNRIAVYSLSYKLECSRDIDSEECDFSQWSTWTDYSFRMSV